MQISKVELENYRIFESLVLTLDGGDLVVSGPPGQGKTTAISCLWELLQKVEDPIMHGKDKGKIKITLSDGKKQVFATRKFTEKTSPLVVLSSEGETISAKEFKTWFDDLAEDPLEILRLGPTDQLKKLVSCVTFPEGFNLEKSDKHIAEWEKIRTSLAPELGKAEKKVGTPAEEVKFESVDQATENLQQIMQLESKYRETEEKSMRVLHTIVQLEKDLEELQKKVLAAQAEKQRLSEWQVETQKWLAENKVDVQPARDKLSNLAAHNDKAREYREYLEALKTVSIVKEKYETAKGQVKIHRDIRKEGLEKATWPLPDLSISDGKIFYNKVPFTQAGSAEQLLVCCALTANSMGNKVLKAVRLDKIECTSKEIFYQIRDIFHEKGIQTLSSRVSWGDKLPGELVIKEGVLINE